YSGSKDTVRVTGSNDAITFGVAGSNLLFTASNGTLPIILSFPTRRSFRSNDQVFFAGSNASLSLSASKDTISLVGTNDVVTITGGHESVLLGALPYTVSTTGTNDKNIWSASNRSLTTPLTGRRRTHPGTKD